MRSVTFKMHRTRSNSKSESLSSGFSSRGFFVDVFLLGARVLVFASLIAITCRPRLQRDDAFEIFQCAVLLIWNSLEVDT